MTPELLRAAQEMIDVLLLENERLAALDFRAATRCLARKRLAAAALEAAQAQCGPMTADPALRQVAHILRDAAETNRVVLERALAVQGKVIGTLAKAARASAPARYGAQGGLAADRARPAFAFSARA